MDDARKADRFLLLFTDGDAVGGKQGRVRATSAGVAVALTSPRLE